jgi:L-asparaginase/Glu-tRNA(Gln) amidotransferase subunit D
VSGTASAVPRVLVVSPGGTITMTALPGAGGMHPTLTAAQVPAAEPRLGQIAEIEALTPMSPPGASLSLQQLRDVAAMLRTRLDGAAGSPVGAVVVQGTDMIEDTAFMLTCCSKHSGPGTPITRQGFRLFRRSFHERGCSLRTSCRRNLRV